MVLMKDRKEIRRVGRFGNSIGVGIPKEIAENLNIKPGDELEIGVNEKDEIVLKKALTRLPEGIDSDMLKMIMETFDQYDDTFKGLKDR
jgi:antitoxin MazE